MDKQLKISTLKKVYDYLFEKKTITSQRDFGKKLGMGDSYTSAMFAGNKPVSSKTIQKIEATFNINFLEFMYNQKAETKPQVLFGTDKFLIVKKVPITASANQLLDYGNPNFGEGWGECVINADIAIIPNRDTLAFEVNGDCMLSKYEHGSIVIAQRLEKIKHLTLYIGKPFVFVTKNGEVALKRLTAFDLKLKTVTFTPDNTAYDPVDISQEDLLQLWEVRMRLSTDL